MPSCVAKQVTAPGHWNFPPRRNTHFYVQQSAGAEYDVLWIATEAVNEWKRFLAARALV